MELTHSFDRWMYHGKRPNYLARLANRTWASLAAAGLGPRRLVRLEVKGRRTGQTVSLPVVVADYQGERYLVSMLGDDANWVRNVRAANGAAAVRHGRRDMVHLEEVEPGKRAEILRRYLACAPGARAHLPVDRRAPTREFQAIAGQFPVFRIIPQGSSAEVSGH
jgi:deazaflavin-dependent oxidoreductase (nitroreductase family)